VLEAGDGREALDVLAGAASLPSLVLLDLILPAMGAEELVPILNQRYPSVRIIVTSGYPEEDVRSLLPAGALAGFLPKPYTLTALGEKVDEILRGGGGPIQKTPAAA
jgi:CheY-like chemotaxis protein